MADKQRLPQLIEPKQKAPKRRGRKLLFFIVLFFIAVLAVLFFRSSISKIDMIEVSGQRYTSEEAIRQAIGLKEGDSFFMATAATLERRIRELPDVREAQAVKRFPGRIEINVTDYSGVAYSVAADGSIRVLLANGRELAPLADETAASLPVLAGWDGHEDNRRLICEKLEQLAPSLLADISQITPEPTASYPDKIRIYTRTQFEVVTTISYLSEKIDYMRSIIDNNEPGVIMLLEANTYRPYINQEEQSDGAEE